MESLYSWFSNFFSFLVDILIWFVDGIKWVLGAFFYAMLEGFYTVILAFFSALDFSSIVGSFAGLWAALPSALSYLIYNSGITQGFSVIVTAMLIRLTLNLIPSVFTRV